MNQLNLGGVYYQAIRARGMKKAKEFLQNFQRLPIEIVLPDTELIWQAAKIKECHAVSCADCFAAALGIRENAKVVTGDPEFRKFGKAIAVEWLS